MTSTDTERHTVGETEIKMTTETTTRMKESPASMGNAITVGKEATGLLLVGRITEDKNTITLKTSYWEPYSVENFKKRTMKNMSNNCSEAAVHHHILHIRRNI